MLGSWATVKNAKTILDIGTGTGLLAIMCAQRNDDAGIYALDSDLLSISEAQDNINKSSWSANIETFHMRLQEFKPQHKLDLIITNPPYFVNSLKSGDARQDVARHTDDLSFEELVSFVKTNLSDTGKLALVLPTTEAAIFGKIARNAGLHLNRKMEVKTTAAKAPSRHLMEFGVSLQPFDHSTLVIAGENSQRYSDEYIVLTKDFYLYH